MYQNVPSLFKVCSFRRAVKYIYHFPTEQEKETKWIIPHDLEVTHERKTVLSPAVEWTHQDPDTHTHTTQASKERSDLHLLLISSSFCPSYSWTSFSLAGAGSHLRPGSSRCTWIHYVNATCVNLVSIYSSPRQSCVDICASGSPLGTTGVNTLP